MKESCTPNSVHFTQHNRTQEFRIHNLFRKEIYVLTSNQRDVGIAKQVSFLHTQHVLFCYFVS